MDHLLIDEELRAKYPHLPFEMIKNKLLNDDSVIIITPKQYKGLLEYRLKNYKLKLNRAKPIRTEKLPDWFQPAATYYNEN
jgi:hypothetical protein